MKTIKVRPWGKGQGDFVLINEADFNPGFHKRFDEPADPPRPRGRRKGGSDEAESADQG